MPHVPGGAGAHVDDEPVFEYIVSIGEPLTCNRICAGTGRPSRPQRDGTKAALARLVTAGRLTVTRCKAANGREADHYQGPAGSGSRTV